jgi:hypothetical protein
VKATFDPKLIGTYVGMKEEMVASEVKQDLDKLKAKIDRLGEKDKKAGKALMILFNDYESALQFSFEVVRFIPPNAREGVLQNLRHSVFKKNVKNLMEKEPYLRNPMADALIREMGRRAEDKEL